MEPHEPARSAGPEQLAEPQVFHCEHCGAPYLEGVTICYSCGAAIGEPEQPTQPVKLPVHLRARTATVPMAPVPGVATAPGGAGTRQATRVRPLSVVLLALSLLVFAAGVVVLYYRLIPPGVPASHVYRDPAHRFHVVQPTLWQAVPYTGGVVLSDATGVTQVLINVSPAEGGETAAMRAEALRQALGLRAAPDLLAGGITWTASTGTLKSVSGAESEMLVLVGQRGERLAIIECTAPAASFDADTRLVFVPLARSFAFG